MVIPMSESKTTYFDLFDYTKSLTPKVSIFNPKINKVIKHIVGVRVEMYKTTQFDVFRIFLKPVQIVIKRKLNNLYNFAPIYGRLSNIIESQRSQDGSKIELGSCYTQHNCGRPHKIG